MKHLSFIRVLATALAIVPLLCFGNGAYVPGTVTIYSNGTYLFGGYNVRYNPAVSKGQVAIAGGGNGTAITVSGTDSNTGAGFYCYIYSTDPLYAAAKEVLYAAKNGVYLAVNRASNGYSACTSFGIQSSSAYQD
jgi:hypothetical protein